jgi:hypothetical protein
MPRPPKPPTCTHLVLLALRKVDDFRSVAQLAEITNCTKHQTGVALHEMRRYGAVDVVVDPSGRGWWFANPEIHDKRSRTVAERTIETRPRRKRTKHTEIKR